MKRLLLILTMLLAPWLGRSADPALAAEIAAAIKQLGAKNFRNRQRASSFLWEHGDQAEAELREAADSSDPEVRSRARKILAKVEAGIFPDTPPELRDLLQRFRGGNAYDKEKATEALLDFGPKAYPAIFRLLRAEADEPMRQLVLEKFPPAREMVQNVFDGRGEWRLVERYLYLAALDNIRVSHYAAYLILTKQLPKMLKTLADDAQGNADLRLSRLLAQLYRAAGDLDAALAAVKGTGKQALIRELHLLRGDYAELAEEVHAAEEAPDALWQLAINATILHWGGDQDDYAALRDDLKRRGVNTPEETWDAMEALLINGELKLALDVARQGGQPEAAFDILNATLQYPAALAMLQRPPDRPLDTQVRLALGAIYLMAFHGDRKPAAERLNQLRENPDVRARPELFQQLMSTALRIRMPATAIELAMEQHERHRTPLDQLANVALSASRQHLWRLRKIIDPPADDKAARGRFARLLQTELDADAKRQLLDAAMARAAALEDEAHPLALREIAAAAQTWQQLDIGLRAMAELDEKSGQQEILLAMGDREWRREEWQKAAEFYRRAADATPSAPLPRYLLGKALERLEKPEQAAKRIREARLLPLGDARERSQLAWGLARRGFAREASREWKLIARTAAPSSAAFGTALRLLARDSALREKDHQKTAAYLRLVSMRLLQPNTRYLDASPYLMIAFAAKRHDAWDARDRGDVDEMLKHAEEAVRMYPRDADFVIDLVAELQRLKRPNDAVRFYRHYIERWRDVLTVFTKSGDAHNNMAWVSARCQRDLDQALDHAKRAVAIRPDNAAYLDTLAEVCFQLGQRDAAVEAAEKAAALEPRDPFFQRRVERFKTEPVKSLLKLRE